MDVICDLRLSIKAPAFRADNLKCALCGLHCEALEDRLRMQRCYVKGEAAGAAVSVKEARFFWCLYVGFNQL